MTVLAITIKQPWAELIVRGIKPVENRGRATPWRRHRGRLLIHSSQTYDHDWAPPFDVSFDDVRVAYTCVNIIARGHLALGHIIGAVDMYDCTDRIRPEARGWHVRGQYGLYFANPVRLTVPIPCPGALGLWVVPEHLEQEVCVMLPGLFPDEEKRPAARSVRAGAASAGVVTFFRRRRTR